MFEQIKANNEDFKVEENENKQIEKIFNDAEDQYE